MKNTYSIVNVQTREIINVQTSFPPCRDLCRAYLTNPDNFGAQLHVVKNIQQDGTGEVVFDVTSIKYSTGRVRMTLWTEFQRQLELRKRAAAKLAEKSEQLTLAGDNVKVEFLTPEEWKEKQKQKASAKKSAKKAK